jgi:hypothetical protein
MEALRFPTRKEMATMHFVNDPDEGLFVHYINSERSNHSTHRNIKEATKKGTRKNRIEGRMTKSSPDYEKRFASIKGARVAPSGAKGTGASPSSRARPARTLSSARVPRVPAHHAICVARPAHEADSQGGTGVLQARRKRLIALYALESKGYRVATYEASEV